jgi:hypothetical protein
VTVDYKITIENGAVSIMQHVDGAAVESGAKPQAVASTLNLLSTSFASSKAKVAGTGGNAGDQPGPGGNAGDQPGPGGNGNGQAGVVVFGPIIVDATGLMQKSLTEQLSKEKNVEKK